MARIEFEKLGRIATGAIQPAPLTMLVGRNNTGKSYVATLLWALTHLPLRFPFSEGRSRKPQWWTNFAKEADKAKAAELLVDAEMQASLVEYLNLELNDGLSDYLDRVFAFSGFAETRARVIPTDEFVPFKISISAVELNEDERGLLVLQGSIIENDKKEVSIRYRMPARGKSQSRRAAERLFEEAVCRSAFGSEWFRIRGSLYIPAARTGLMLAFKSLIAQSFERGLDEDGVILPVPMTEFLRRLTFNFPYPRTSKRAEISRWIEGEILHGAIEATDDEVPQFSYTSKSLKEPIPLHATSSMITEVAPFLLALRNRISEGLIIFEEPEAHLHLSAQRDMARAIARLINAGSTVLVTTHSDTFVQQINNLMTIYSHAERDKMQRDLGYKNEDLLDPLKVKVYEFLEKDDATEVVEVLRDGSAFGIRSLNETLMSLAHETISLHEEG